MAKLTGQDREDILRRVEKGVAVAVLAEEFKVSEQCIRTTVKKYKAVAGADAPERLAKMGPAPIIPPVKSEMKEALKQFFRKAAEAEVKKILDEIF